MPLIANDRNRFIGWITISILFFALWWLEEIHEAANEGMGGQHHMVTSGGDTIQAYFLGGLTLTIIGTHVELTLDYPSGGDAQVLSGVLGMHLPPGLPGPQPCPGGPHPSSHNPEDIIGDDSSVCLQWSTMASLEVRQDGDSCYAIQWQTNMQSLQDCFRLGSDYWFGGGETDKQSWPLSRNASYEAAFVTGFYYYGVAERYWVSSAGVVLYVEDSVPLFVSQGDSAREDSDDGGPQMCLTSARVHPFREQPGLPLPLKYKLCALGNIKSAHMHALPLFLGKPSTMMDQHALRYPIWSTWARYKTKINDSIVLHFAGEITDHGFNSSQLEIDDKWEPCYGEMDFDPAFGDPKQLVKQLHSLDFRVTLWVHPFINFDCAAPFDQGMDRGYLVPDPNGHLAFTQWWNGGPSGIIDVTDLEAALWWHERLDKLRRNYGIDGFKFDAGETNWLPYCASLSGPENLQPNVYTTRYAELAALFGGITEVRSGHRTQHLGVMVRILDRNSDWGAELGLRSVIPTVLVFGLLGYPFVLPDMVGGNSYSEGPPDKELYVRWMEANTFMPTIQFSIVPWDFDREVVDIALKMTQLRDKYYGVLYEAAQESVKSGAPINRPLWWVDPTDRVALTMDTEFMVGDELLVAPVLDQGRTSRDIYLPRGLWRDEMNPSADPIQGPVWLYNYTALLADLPHFTLQNQ